MDFVIQIVIALITTTLGSILSYFASIRKSKDEIKALEIKSDNEIKKIESEYQKQIEKMKAETEEQIKLKIAESDLVAKENDEKLKNEAMSMFLSEFMKDPQKGATKLKAMQDIANMFKQN